MDILNMTLPVPLILAVAATLGYLFGRRTRTVGTNQAVRSRRDLRRAHLVAAELEKIARGLRQSLADHHGSISRFRDRLKSLNDQHDEAAIERLCREAEEMLKPTQRLASDLAAGYDEIRQQTAHLMAFTEVRTDPLTGVHNRRGMEDALNAQLAVFTRYETPFALAILDIDLFKQVNDCRGHLDGDNILQELAKLLDESARETDVVARYGGEEFVVIMPQTDYAGACLFTERLRCRVEEKMCITISGGVAAVTACDTRETLLHRADSALYEAKGAGRNRVFGNDGNRSSQVAELAEVG